MLDPKSEILYYIQKILRMWEEMLQLEFQRYKIIITYFHSLLYLSYGSSLVEFLFLREGHTNAIAV